MRLLDCICAAGAVVMAGIAFWSGALDGNRILATVVAVSFALLAWLLRGVDLSGAVAGAAIAFVFYRSGGWRLFAALFFVFVVTQLSTRISGVHPEPRGRTAAQVLANLFVPALVLILRTWIWYFSFVWVQFVLSALAELAADTVSSEIGERFGGSVYLFPSLKKTTAGMNGGISATGTLAGVLAAASILVPGMILFSGTLYLWIAAVAGIFGMFVDSFLGTMLENRGWLSNESVNLLGVSSAVSLAWVLITILP